MKPVVLTVSVLALFGALTLACDDGSALEGDGRSDTNENTPLANNKKSDSTTTPPSSAENSGTSSDNSAPKPNSGTTPPKPATGDCSQSATQADCMKCCGVNNNPIKTCGCTAGATCEKACGANLCADKTPDIACGICLAQANCEIGDDPGAAAQSCIEQSACAKK